MTVTADRNVTNDMTVTRWKRWRRRLAIAALVLFVLEIGIRLLPEEKSAPVNYGYPPTLFVPDRELGHGLRIDFRGKFTRHEGFAIATDGRGHRGSAGEPAATNVLHVLGDGVAFGKYVRDSELFSRHLARELEDTRVVNHAVPFYSLAHQERLLARRLQQGLGGFVLLALNPSDLEPFHTHGEVIRALGASRPGVVALPPDDPQRTLDRQEPLPFPLRYSALASEARKLVFRFRAWRNPRLRDAHARYIKVQLRRCASPAARERASAIARMAAELKKKKVGFAIAFFPHEFDLMGEDWRDEQSRRPRDLMLGEAKRAGVASLDLTPIYLQQADPISMLRRPDVMHPSARGHQVAARAIARFLRSRD